MKLDTTTINEETGLIESASAIKPAPITSPKYAYISTKDIVNEVKTYGWELITQGQAKTKNPERMGFQKHILIFEHPEFKDYSLEGNYVGKNQLVIRNSHDHSSSLQLFLGYMRIACSNQIFAKNFGTEGFYESVKHIGVGDKTNEAIDRFNLLVEKMKVFKSIIKQLSSKELSQAKQKDFAKKVIDLRFKDTPYITESLEPEILLQPTRYEDNRNDAWTVFNRVQEKIIKGGLHVKKFNPKKGKYYEVQTRAIKSPNTLPDLNNKMLQALNEVVYI